MSVCLSVYDYSRTTGNVASVICSQQGYPVIASEAISLVRSRGEGVKRSTPRFQRVNGLVQFQRTRRCAVIKAGIKWERQKFDRLVHGWRLVVLEFNALYSRRRPSSASAMDRKTRSSSCSISSVLKKITHVSIRNDGMRAPVARAV